MGAPSRFLLLPILLPAILALPAAGPAQARPAHHRHGAPGSDPDRTLARMAAHDRLASWPAWEEDPPAARRLPPATREQLPAPPFTGWGYGATIPGAGPGF